MQLWWVRSCGFFGGELREIRRGADNLHTHVRSDTHCDHVLRDLLTGSHASVKYPELSRQGLPASFIQGE